MTVGNEPVSRPQSVTSNAQFSVIDISNYFSLGRVSIRSPQYVSHPEIPLTEFRLNFTFWYFTCTYTCQFACFFGASSNYAVEVLYSLFLVFPVSMALSDYFHNKFTF